MTDNNPHQKVWDLIDQVKFAMLVTQGKDGKLFARPMVAQEKAKDDNLWFFTGLDSPKVSEIEKHPEVLVSYADPASQTYVSISGPAKIVNDRAKIHELWDESLKAWFPLGKDDANICLICVDPQSAEYWDNPSSTFVQAFGYLKAKVTGEPEQFGENKVVGM